MIKPKVKHKHYWDFTGAMKAKPCIGMNGTLSMVDALVICHSCGAMRYTTLENLVSLTRPSKKGKGND